MIALAVLNVVLVTDNIVSSGFKVSPTLILAASFQVHLDTQYTGHIYNIDFLLQTNKNVLFKLFSSSGSNIILS